MDLLFIFDRKSKSLINTKNDGINSNSEKNLKLIEHNPKITTKEIVETLKISSKTVERCIKNLKDKNILTREGSRKSEKWIIVEDK